MSSYLFQNQIDTGMSITVGIKGVKTNTELKKEKAFAGIKQIAIWAVDEGIFHEPLSTDASGIEKTRKSLKENFSFASVADTPDIIIISLINMANIELLDRRK